MATPVEARQSRRMSALATATPRPEEAPAARSRRRSTGDRMETPKSARADRRHWLVANNADWHQAPKNSSTKLGQLHKGQVVTEASTERTFDGWVPIEPRGFVEERSLKPRGAPQKDYNTSLLASACSPNPRSPVSAEKPRRSRVSEGHRSSLGSDPPVMNSQTLLLREEQVQIREANAALKEEKIATRMEIQELQEQRDQLAREVEELRAERGALHASRDAEAAKVDRLKLEYDDELVHLERVTRQHRRMKEKLAKCCEVVKLTVASVDRMYAEKAADERGEGGRVIEAREQAVLAGQRASEQLEVFEEEEDYVSDCAREPRDREHPLVFKENSSAPRPRSRQTSEKLAAKSPGGAPASRAALQVLNAAPS